MRIPVAVVVVVMTALPSLADPLDPAVLAINPYVDPSALDAAQLAELCTAAGQAKAIDSYAMETAKTSKGAANGFAQAAGTMAGLESAEVSGTSCMATLTASGFVDGKFVEALRMTCAVSEFIQGGEVGWTISNLDPESCAVAD